MRIIFLDIDGVLNSIDSMLANNNRNKNMDALDYVSIGLLRKLCIETDARIVISSTWRYGRTEEDFIDIFSQYDWPEVKDLIIGMTPIINGDCRGYEIESYLKTKTVLGPMYSEYIILDDDSDMLDNQLDRFIYVSNINGFRSQHYVKALRLFGVPNDRLESQVNFKRTTTKGDQPYE
jgi:hypothetical protein